ncbi:Glycerol-3-phosphate acyltransferase 4 [Halotydeus destructor]|nr:Glycerol-3-phosphate acyltransferase 4 [Halotydeus destructor]
MHHILALVWFLYLNYLLGAFICFSLFLTLFALFGIETGIHRKYVQLLLKTFEFCRRTIETRDKNKNGGSGTASDCDTSSDEEDEDDDLKPMKRHRIMSMNETFEEPRDFHLADIFEFIHKGVRDITDDEVTKRFDANELRSWNLLTRTNKNYQFVSWRITFYWVIGFIVRFYFLFPIRLAIFAFGMLFFIFSTSLVGLMSDGPFKRWVYYKVSITAFRILSRSVSAVISYRNEQYKPKGGGICAANHTSPFDVVMLHCDNAYALVGQLQGGFLGLMERQLSKATSHVFFDRFEVTDRLAVTRRMKSHISDPDKLPILIFPEGTCINNSAVMMFKKGSFEVASTVYPVAIKYDQAFGDPFWNSSKHGYFTYLLRMMTSWAIVCDVWYLPPMSRMDHESASEFAGRVKSAIARQGGLVDLQWDGQLKRNNPRPEFKQEVQRKFSRKISVRTSVAPDIKEETEFDGRYSNHLTVSSSG